jgi:hypothetical protein
VHNSALIFTFVFTERSRGVAFSRETEASHEIGTANLIYSRSPAFVT